MSKTNQPFLRIEILKFQINNTKQIVDLSKVKTEIEIKEKNQTTKEPLIKRPMFNENNQSIRFDIGIYVNIERQISIRIISNEILYLFELDLKNLQKLADGHRHQFNFTPKAQSEMIIEYKDPSSRGDCQSQVKMHDRRYAERYQKIHKHLGHSFVAKVFKIPSVCTICKNVLWGFGNKGFQCQRCDYVIHKDCYNRCDRLCSGKKHSDYHVSKPHKFDHQSFSLQTYFCDHDGSFIRPGHVYKCNECSMIVHRRCRSKVGDYCGFQARDLELYDEWKKNHKKDSDYNYQYNGDLSEIYVTLHTFTRTTDTKEVIERMTKIYKPHISNGFDINQIEFLRKLGQGMSGTVYLVKRDETYYAMKVLNKKVILEGHNTGYIQSERDILTLCQSNPFFIQLHYAFQNAERLFFLMEVARAGTLYDLLDLQAPRPFRQEQIIFYTGQVACAIAFLHSKHIIYRDLKPENILIFEDGNLKLGDFGLAKQNIDKNHKTDTICGTPEYMAYEIYNNDSYDLNIDWWGLGILIYELSTFKTPFYASNSTDISQNVLSNRIHFPETMPIDVKSIIEGLLERNPKRRLGNNRSPHGLIKDQPFFKEPYTYDAIEGRRVPPPWIPKTFVSLKPSRNLPKLSEIDEKDAILLLSTPTDTFKNFSYINPNIVTLF